MLDKGVQIKLTSLLHSGATYFKHVLILLIQAKGRRRHSALTKVWPLTCMLPVWPSPVTASLSSLRARWQVQCSRYRHTG